MVVLPPTETTEYGGKEAMSVIADQALTAVLSTLAPR
jgi:hypothetical protein